MQPYPDRLQLAPFYSMWVSLPPIRDRVDPFDMEQRMAIMRTLIERINANGAFGDDNSLNIFWAYVLQLHWQWRSGRFALAGAPAERIDPNSIWGYNNYYLMLLPLVAAVQVGMLDDLTILPPDLPSKVDYISGGGGDPIRVPPIFERALESWRGLMRLIEQTPRDGDLEPIRFKLWEAHGHTLRAAQKANDVLLEGCGCNEADFLIGWVRMVDFLQAAAWRTDYDFILETGLEGLPERILRDDDVPGEVGDLSEMENSTLKSVFGLVKQPQWQFNLGLWVWKRAMRKREARDQVTKLMDATFNPTPENAPYRKKMLRYVLALT